jgi:DNA polymerase III epsilon subunit-like protein
MLVLVFDTETTGLPKSKIINKDTLHLWPYIVQFSYIIFDTEFKTLVKMKDCIIRIPDFITISEEVSKIHGITNDISLSKGINIINILNEFFTDFSNVDYIVGHNISFDLNMIRVELNRVIINSNNDEEISEFQTHLTTINASKNIYCTMKESIDLCAIQAKDKFGRSYNKFPKLIELYQKLFSITPNNLHNSLNDVIVCLRCFMKLKYDNDIVEYSPEVKRLIKEYL